jgi:hypothetical protein
MARFDEPRWSEFNGPVDPVPGRLHALLMALRADGLEPVMAESGRAVAVPAGGSAAGEIRATCRMRHDDGGALWFFGPNGRPLAMASDVMGAVAGLRDLAAPR